MRVSHRFAAVFDDANLVSCAGLAPLLQLAGNAGLPGLIGEHLTVGERPTARFPAVKIGCLVAGMAAGADSIDDLDLIRHGGLGRLCSDRRAPSTLGTFLRSFSFGHVRQLDAVASRLLANLAGAAPILPGRGGQVALDVDDTVRRTYGYAKQGVGYGYTGVKGLNAAVATASGVDRSPVIAAVRLRKGGTHSARGAHRLVADALSAARRAGIDPADVLVRADSAYYTHKVVQTVLRRKARVSVTARQDKAVQAAIATIPAGGWTRISYPSETFDEQTGCWVSAAEVAEVPFTAFTSRPRSEQVSARLIVRRVVDANPAHQNGLFTVYRHHAVFTNSSAPLVEAETWHRRHAIIEQVIAELKNGPLAHLPSGQFAANSAWLALAAITHNLLRTLGALAGLLHRNQTAGTLRTQLINVPARIARSARTLTLHLPTNWPWQTGWTRMTDQIALGPPPTG